MEQPDSSKFDYLIDAALQEDIGPGDITTEAMVRAEQLARGTFVAHQDGVVAGLILLEPIFHKVDVMAKLQLLARDGGRVRPGQELAWVECHSRAVLAGERAALNFLQRLSGIASYARRCVDLVDGTGVRILDTRKTVPGWRHLEKYAVRCGGAVNHRMGLYDMVLIKENHQEISHHTLREAVEAARRSIAAGVLIEVEVHDLANALGAVEAGADVVMLDNMGADAIRRGVTTIRQAEARLGRKVIIELSGGIHVGNLRDFAQLGADWISLGAITHSAPALDISLDIKALD
jgi:nicotinate-nucleotide pyrophosphorylase (carboxylating)